jgi:hypothetical protein
VPATDPIFRNDSLQRQLAPEAVAAVMQAAGEPRVGVPRRVLAAAGAGGGLLVLAFPVEALLAQISRFSAAQAVRQGDSGAMSSVHTLSEIAEEPGVLPAAAACESRLEASVATLRQMPDVSAMASGLASRSRATAAQLLEAIAADHACCHLLHATPVRNAQTGALRGIKMSHS